MKDIILRITFTFCLVFSLIKINAQSPGCPDITPVGATICQGKCANLTATVIPNNATTSYAVSSIPYTPYAYTGGTGVSVGTDDVWSSIINLPFNFCFFGVNHTKIKLGSNGQIMFSPANGGGANAYPVTVAGALPSTANTPGNTINVFRDIDPSEGGNVKYYIGGAAPCRYLVYYYKKVPLYSCDTPESTFQMVIYENTNFIDIYIENSSGSCYWQGGRGIVGIQNAAGTVAYTAPGRNSNDGNWTAINEAWRFSPSGAPSYSVTWYGPGNTVVGSGLGPISVCPSTTTNYTASMIVTNCNGAQTTYSNTTSVIVNSSPTVNIASTGTLNCTGNTAITTTVTPASAYAWSGPGAILNGGTGNPSVNQPGVYTVTATAAGCSRTGTINMVTSPPIVLSVNSPGICLGSTATLTGSGALTYTWLPGSTTTNPLQVSPTSQTSYTLKGTNAAGCTGSVVSTVTMNPMPSSTLNGANPTCGLNNGIVTINNTSSVGQAPFVFNSSVGSVSGQTITALPAGVTTVSITNVLGCVTTSTVNLTNQAGPTNINTSLVNPTCGLSNGSITFASPTGGSAPYTYSVNNISATSPVSGLSSGNYSITVKDNNGCVFIKVLNLAASSSPTAITGIASPAGCALSNGTYSITGVTGGVPAYSFSVNSVSTSTLINGLASGIKTITVIDNFNCTYSTTISIPQLTGPTALTTSTTLASCGTANGSATVTSVTGGQAPFQYNFNGLGFSASDNVPSQVAGSYTVVVKDANSCTVTAGYGIANAGSPSVSITAVNDVTCFGLSNGSFTAAASGGAGAPYTYTLSSPFQVNGLGQFSGLASGNYLVSVRDAANCIATATVFINEPTAVTFTPSSLPANCFATLSGTVSAFATGGNAPYEYSLNGGAFQTSNTYTSQGAAIYNIAVRDANLCVATQTIEVTEPLALSIAVSSQSANCVASNGVASATVTGGTPIYTYSWSGSGGSSSVASNLATGNYSITATDSKGCAISSVVNVGQLLGGSAIITSSANITCAGLDNGNLTAGMTGGNAPFSYIWTTGGQTNATATNLGAGTYTCEITDFYGCKAYAFGNISQPTPLMAIMNSNNVKCFGSSSGTVIASGNGGTAPYTYLWPTLASTLSIVNNVAIGDYSVNITDANNCTITSSITVTQPSEVTLSASVTPATCNQSNGSATITANGGTPAYSYTWSTGVTSANANGLFSGTYTISVRDDNNCIQTLAATIPNLSGPTVSVVSSTNISCYGGSNGAVQVQASGGTSAPGFPIYNWSNGQNTAVATNLLMGVYTVSVTDATGCIASTSVNVTEPPLLTATITATQPKCFGQANGFGVAAALGGSPSYSYAWTSVGGNSPSSNQLGAGVYGLTVTDGNDCIALSTMTLNNPPPMSVSISHTNSTCFSACNGLAVGTTSNAAGVVSYFWTGGSSAITTQTATGLCAGSYTLLATDQNNCTSNNLVTILEPTALVANITTSGTVTCNGGSNGFATVSPSGGTPAYNYSWSGVASANGNSSNANNLPAGNYTVTVSDTKSCTANAVVTILQPLPLTTTLTSVNAKCYGSCDASANISFSGGAGLTTFLWSPGLQSGNFVNNLCAGSQSVNVTYNGSCSSVLTFSISQPGPLTAVVTATSTNCQQNNGKVCATTNGGTAPYSYLWSNGVTTQCSNNVLAGAYSFSVTDVNSCKASAVALVNDIEGPTVSVLSTANVKCFNGNDGAANISIVSGVSPYTITWSSNNSTAQNVTNFYAGTHNVTVIDAAGCVGAASLTITQPTKLVSAVAGYTNITCFGLSNGSAEVSVNGGMPNYTYNWIPSGQTSNVMANVLAGTYTCQIKDLNNCQTNQIINISQPQALIFAASSSSNISCSGGSNGQISTVAQGGTPGYIYNWTPVLSGNSGVHGGLALGAYSVTVTDTRNCSVSAGFTISEPGPLNSTFTSYPARCGNANGSATLSINGGTPIYNVSWNTSPLQSGLVANNMAPGNWSAIVTDSKGCTLTQTVNVANALIPVISGFNVSTPLCFGQPNGSIIMNYTSGTPNYTVSWSNPISQIQQTPSQSVSVSGVGSGVYTATVVDSYGCSASLPVNVTQPSLLVLNVTPPQTICYGSSAQIYAQGQGGTNSYTYTWSSGFSGGGPHTVNPTGNANYNVSMVDANGCSSPPKAISVIVTPPLSTSGSLFTKCHTDNILLMPVLTSPGNSGPYTYLWSGGETTESISVMASNANTPVQYTVTIDDGCTIPSATAVFTVNVNPLPALSFSASATSGCAPLTVIFSASSNDVNNTYAWGNNYGNDQNVSVVFQDSGKYEISVSVLNPTTGCSRDTTIKNFISVYPQPIASFNANPQPTTILDPTIYFTNTSQNAVSYFWDFGEPSAPNNTNSSIFINPNHSYATTGIYNVNLVALSDKGCRDTATVSIEIKPDYAIYIPNTFSPDGNGVNDFFFPLGVGINEDNYRLDIFDRWGENVFSSNNFRKGWDGSIKGGKTAPQGTYIYKIMVYDLQGNKYPYTGHISVIRKDE